MGISIIANPNPLQLPRIERDSRCFSDANSANYPTIEMFGCGLLLGDFSGHFMTSIGNCMRKVRCGWHGANLLVFRYVIVSSCGILSSAMRCDWTRVVF